MKELLAAAQAELRAAVEADDALPLQARWGDARARLEAAVPAALQLSERSRERAFTKAQGARLERLRAALAARIHDALPEVCMVIDVAVGGGPHASPMARVPDCLAAAVARQRARGLTLRRDGWAQHRGALPGEITALEEFQRLAEVPGEREASAGAPKPPRHCPHGASRPRSSMLSSADGRRAGRRGGALSAARG